MSKEQIKAVRVMKQNGKIENKDFRVVYFGISAEIKVIG